VIAKLERREFITLLGGAAAAWPLAARAQQSGRLPTIGVLGGATPSAESQRVAALVQRLHELGWIEGHTIAIEYRWAEGRSARLAEIAAEFVRLGVDVIFATGTAPALAAKQATSMIPIVFPFAGDPIGTGLVASLARPGGNVTGMSNQATDLAAKRIELLREIVPHLRRLAVLANAGYPAAALEKGEVAAAARTLDLEVVSFEIRESNDIAPAFEAVKGKAEALFLVGDPLMTANRIRVTSLALAARLPTIYVHREYVDAGGLISYGANFPDLFRRAAEVVDKILRGTKPGDIPVEQPTKFELAINLKTANALGLDVPPTLLALADEVIE
jgi:putative tryptophan/tyrosine transport system substrate-binding protein